MRLRFALVLALIVPVPAIADTLVAARTIRARAIIAPADLSVIGQDIPGALATPDEALGLESRVVLYAGHPIRPGDIGPPAIVERNQIVTLVFQSGPLTILAEARALGRAGVGDMVRVMNLASRNTVSGVVRPDGSVTVGSPPNLATR